MVTYYSKVGGVTITKSVGYDRQVTKVLMERGPETKQLI